MKKVLIPVDFTEVSFNAFKYAMDLFGNNGEYHLVHIRPGIAGVPVPTSVESSVGIIDTIEEQIEKIVIETFNYETLPKNIFPRSEVGEVVNSIKSIVQKEKFDCLVLGSRDNYDVFDRWFGTTSLGIVKSLDLAIYMVPRYSTFNDYEKVVVATDKHLKDPGLIANIKEWNANHKAYINFLHIRSTEENAYGVESKQLISELFEHADPDFGFEISSIYSERVSESLLASAYNFKADILIVVAEQHSFLHTLLFKSVSKDLILKSSIPVLFIHDKT